MAKSISFKKAKEYCTTTMARPIEAHGFEHREVADHIVNILYFSCQYEHIGVQYRMEIFVDGMATSGIIL